MAQMITTEKGDVLTSPMNAGSLSRGDQIAMGTEEAGYVVLTVFSVNRMVLDQTTRWVEFEPPDGYRFGLPLGVNEPVARLVGARSGGVIGGM